MNILWFIIAKRATQKGSGFKMYKRIFLTICVLVFCNIYAYSQNISAMREWISVENQMRGYALECLVNVKGDSGAFNNGRYTCIIGRTTNSNEPFTGIVSFMGYNYSETISRRIINYANIYFDYFYKKNENPIYGESWNTDDWYYEATIDRNLLTVSLHFSEENM
jgi:hypothetical protein